MRNDKWTPLASTKQNNYHAACTVFEGKIVVIGGKNKLSLSKYVEAYDYYEDKWTYLADMIKERFNHAAVSMGNKMFVIAGLDNSSCEVFDSFSRKFTCVNAAVMKIVKPSRSYAVCVGNKIIIFCKQWCLSETRVFIYDVSNDSWSEKMNNIVNNLAFSSYIKYSSK